MIMITLKLTKGQREKLQPLFDEVNGVAGPDKKSLFAQVWEDRGIEVVLIDFPYNQDIVNIVQKMHRDKKAR